MTAPDPLQSSAAATIDLSSVDTGNEMRDNDLRSGNFFDAARHPAMTYRSTGIRPAASTFLVDGELTIRGVTRPITLTVEVNGFGPDPYGGTRAGFSATGEMGRTEYGISFNAPVPGGGVMVSEKIQIEIEAEAVLRTGRQRLSPPRLVSVATHSTWWVMGNASKARSAPSCQPAAANTAMSRASVAGSQDT